MPGERIHDLVDRSRDVEKPLNNPSQRGNCSANRAADSEKWVRAGSAHEQ